MSDEIIISEQIDNGTPEKGTIIHEKGLGYTMTVDRGDLLKAAKGLKEAGFDLFMFVAGVDYPDRIKLVYRIYSTKRQNKIAVIIKTEVPKSDPVIDSLVPVWSAANWHERETFDLYGVEFKGHPDLRRILMPEYWVGYPMRKDYSDDHMIVMDDGKKEKPAAAIKDKPAPKKDTAEPVVEAKPEAAVTEVKVEEKAQETATATPAESPEETVLQVPVSEDTPAETVVEAAQEQAQPEAPENTNENPKTDS